MLLIFSLVFLFQVSIIKGILSKSADDGIEDDKEKPIEEVKPKTRVEFEAYAKRLSAMIVANSVSTMLFFYLKY